MLKVEVFTVTVGMKHLYKLNFQKSIFESLKISYLINSTARVLWVFI